MGCNDLSPCYRQWKRVSAVAYFYYSVPVIKTGLVAYR